MLSQGIVETKDGGGFYYHKMYQAHTHMEWVKAVQAASILTPHKSETGDFAASGMCF